MVYRASTDAIQAMELEVFSNAFRFKAPIPYVLDATATRRPAGPSTAELALPGDSSVLAFMREPAARCIIRHRGEILLSGQIRDPAGDTNPTGEVRFQVQGDWRILENTLAVPAPRNPLAPEKLGDLGQAWQTGPAGDPGTVDGQSGYFRFPDGIDSAEACIKHLIGENLLVRHGRPVTVRPNRDRGGDARAAGIIAKTSIRMKSVAEAIQPFIDFSGLNVRVWQEPGAVGYVIDVEEPKTFPTTLSYASGILTDSKYAIKDPASTRVIYGGNGEDAARTFGQVIDTALETQRGGDIIETYFESTDGPEIEWDAELDEKLKVPKYAPFHHAKPDSVRAYLAALEAAGRGELAELAATIGLDVDFRETRAFYLGGAGGVHDGDHLTIDLGGTPYRDRLVSTTVSQGEQFTVSGMLGNAPLDEDDELWSAMAALTKMIQKRTRR
jgi:hypothetical protein